jgi:hypothetical protein
MIGLSGLSLWRGLRDRMTAARRRRDETRLDRCLAPQGEQMTDSAEREIFQRVTGGYRLGHFAGSR